MMRIRPVQVPEAGVLQTTFEQGFRAVFETGGAQGGAQGQDSDLSGDVYGQIIADLNRGLSSLKSLQAAADARKNSAAIAVLVGNLEALMQAVTAMSLDKISAER